jgi:hypothetical protein
MLNEEIKNIKLIIAVCYSDMPSSIEPKTSTQRFIEKKQKFLMQIVKLNNPHLRTVHYMRPIAEEWNATKESIEKSLMFGRSAEGIVVGGITLWDYEIEEIKRQGLSLPNEPPGGWHAYGYRRKYLPRSIKELIVNVWNELGLNTPVLSRASCAVSNILKIQDYNGYKIENEEKNCLVTCPASQQALCRAIKSPTSDLVKEALGKMQQGEIPFVIEENKRVLLMPKEDQLFGFIDGFALRHLLGFPGDTVESITSG